MTFPYLTEQEYHHRLQVLQGRYGTTWVLQLLQANQQYQSSRIYPDPVNGPFSADDPAFQAIQAFNRSTVDT